MNKRRTSIQRNPSSHTDCEVSTVVTYQQGMVTLLYVHVQWTSRSHLHAQEKKRTPNIEDRLQGPKTKNKKIRTCQAPRPRDFPNCILPNHTALMGCPLRRTTEGTTYICILIVSGDHMRRSHSRTFHTHFLVKSRKCFTSQKFILQGVCYLELFLFTKMAI